MKIQLAEIPAGPLYESWDRLRASWVSLGVVEFASKASENIARCFFLTSISTEFEANSQDVA